MLLQIILFFFVIAGWKPRQKFGRIWEQISENPRGSRGFSSAREFSPSYAKYPPSYEGTEKMFYFFYKIIIFQIDIKKDEHESHV